MKKRLFIFLTSTVLLATFSQATAQAVDASDSLALVDLFNSTDGPHWFYHNNWLQKPVKDWDYITLTQNGTRVKVVYLNQNNLTGEIPASIGNLSSCEWLSLDRNHINGKIPNSIGNLVNVQQLWLNNNQLSGEIPLSLGSLPNLFSLDLTSNNLSGKIPDNLGSMPNLKSISIQYNKFTFDGMEKLVQRHLQNFTYYGQDTILQLGHKNDTLFVTAGGTLQNNTYAWYKNGVLVATIKGDSTFLPTSSGSYIVYINNSIANAFTLHSNTLSASPVLVIDPNPSMITANGSINTDLSNINYNKTVTKAATDGVTKLLLVTNSSSPVTFSIDGNISGTLSSITNQLTKGNQITITPDANGRVVCIYTVPDGYGLANPPGGRVCTIEATGANNYSSTARILLVTPPVVLVHGMWSKPEIWEKGGFVSSLNRAGIGGVELADYRDFSAETFDPGSVESFASRTSLLVRIILALKNYRDQRIAATQVDVVGHSLGGLISRSLSQQTSTFQTLENYYQGYFHKLITLGTPHRGSPLGLELYNIRDKWTHHRIPFSGKRVYLRLDILMEFLGMPIGGCHRDFAITSQGILNLQKTLPFKTFSVTANNGMGDNPISEIGSYLVMDELVQFINGRHLDTVMKSRCNVTVLPSDLVVPQKSQTGYINATQLFRGTAHSIPGLVTETNNPLVQKRVAELLLSDDTTEFSNGFPAPSSFPLESCDNATQRTINTVTEIRDNSTKAFKTNVPSDAYVELSASVRGAAFHQGVDTALTVSFTTSGGVMPVRALLMIQDVGWFLLPTTFPYQTSISIPGGIAAGRSNIVLLVQDSTGTRYSDTSHISILPGGRLTGVSVQPSSLHLDSMNRESKISIREAYTGDSGITYINYSSISEGVSYLTQKNEMIVKISADGTVAAVNPGTDTITISKNGNTFRIPVFVDVNFSLRTLFNNTITFPAIQNRSINDAIFALAATASSGELVSYTLVSGPATLENGVITLTGTGIVTITANAGGNSFFGVAAPVTRSFYVTGTLPLQMLSFTGRLINGGIVLDWSTTNEQNTSYFIVERSTNGIIYAPLAKVGAVGFGQAITKYSYNDTTFRSPKSNQLFYRLIQVDKDSVRSLSKVVTVSINPQNRITVYPNPVTRRITVQLGNILTRAFIQLYSTTGQLVWSERLSNQLSQEIFLSGGLKGNYTAVIMSNGKIVHQQSIVILK